MTDVAKTLTFLEELCKDAAAAAHKGDVTLANRLAANKAISHYFSNVAMMHAVPAQQWALQYPQLLDEADHVRVEYEHAAQLEADRVASQERITTLEGKLEALTAQIAALLEAKQPAKKTAKKAAVVEAEVKADTEEEKKDEAETEPEPAVDGADAKSAGGEEAPKEDDKPAATEDKDAE